MTQRLANFRQFMRQFPEPLVFTDLSAGDLFRMGGDASGDGFVADFARQLQAWVPRITVAGAVTGGIATFAVAFEKITGSELSDFTDLRQQRVSFGCEQFDGIHWHLK